MIGLNLSLGQAAMDTEEMAKDVMPASSGLSPQGEMFQAYLQRS